jgi:PAS domain S-box-containing protein
VAINLVTTRNVDDFLNVVRDELRSIFDFDGMVVGFMDAQHEFFQTVYEVDQEPGLEVWPVKKSLSGMVVSEKKGLLYTDESILELFEKGRIDIFGKISKCWMGAPLVYEGKVIGVILVQSFHNTKAYDNTSLQVLEIIANQLSIYIEQKRAMVTSTQLFKGIEQSPVIIIIANKQGIISYVNTRFTEITGYSSGEAIGRNPRFLKSNEHDTPFYENLWQTILSGNTWEGEFRNIKKNGDFYWEKTIISPLVDEKGEIIQFIAFKEDITEKKIMMADLVKSKEKAEESDRLKSAFLANLSHEIRTPMNAILGFTELLQDPENTFDIISNYVSIIHRSGYHLLGIINDIIEISKIETGQISPNFNHINLGALISDLFEAIKITIPVDKEVILHIDPPDSINDRIIFTDEVKLTQVLTNLITNALKFTDQGSVGFGYVVKKGFLEFSVKDTGIGIDELNHRLIFDRFYQIESDLRIRSGGSGLGLAISKAYIEMLGGTITVKSKMGHGATLIFTIPFSDKK